MKNLLYLTILLLVTNTAQSQTFQWAKRGGASDQLATDSGARKEEVYSMVTDTNKNIYILSSVGKTNLNIDGHPKTNFGDYTTLTDIVLASFACDGSYRWSKVFWGGGKEDINNLQIDALNNIYIAGKFGTCASTSDGDPPRIDDDVVYPLTPADCSITFLTKFNANGVMQWFKKLQPTGIGQTEGITQVGSYGLAADNFGTSYWLTLLGPGTYCDEAFVNTQTGLNYFLLKYNSAGTFISATPMDMQITGGAIGELKMYYNPNNGNLYFTGRLYTETQTVVLGGQTVTHALYIASFNTQGQFLWKTEDSSTVAQGAGINIFNLTFDAQNNIYLGGSFGGFNFDSILGFSISEFIAPSFVMKTNPTCSSILWVTHSDIGNNGLGAIALNGNEVGFTSSGFETLNWGTQTITMGVPNGGTEVLFARFNKDTGACLSLSKIPGDVGYDDEGTALAVDASGDYIIGGNFGHQLLVNGTTTLLNNGPQTDFFVAKYATEVCSPLANEEFHLAKESRLTVAPNPTNSSTVVYYKGGNSSSSLVLTDMLGRTLQSITLTSSKGTINLDCSNYAQGQYMLLLKENDTVIENTKLLINK